MSGPGLRARLDSFRFKVRRRYERRFRDPELRQMRSLQRSYSGANPPELLIFGDSAMFRTQVVEDDRRHLADLILAEVGAGVEAELLVGPGYQPRIVSSYLDALGNLPGRPKVAVVPTSILMAASLWYQHPHYSYARESEGLAAAAAGHPPKRLARSTADDFESYDKLPAPSLFGARRTAGELRLIVNAKPESRWQHAIRTRHILDYYFAETLSPDLPGMVAIQRMGEKLRTLGIPAVAYMAPCNFDLTRTALGPEALEHLERNGACIEEVVRSSFPEGTVVVNALTACPGDQFADAAHLNDKGRAEVAHRIAGPVRQLLGRP